MRKQEIVNGSLALDTKSHRVITIPATEQPQDVKLRVAAYARVSSSSEDQLNSFAAQNDHYTTLISDNENWMLVDIYADEGISGTSAEKRDEFQRMMSDCRRGLIDRVLVKSISRFARNTTECLEAVRELKALGVSVFFEEQGIDTGTMSSESMTAIFASLAQEESRNISANMRWSYQRRMESGTFLPSSAPYGYEIVDGEIQIVEREAEIIRQIFADYLAGVGTDEIAKKLQSQYAETGKKWSARSVSYVLTNERYIGDSLWQKTYATDTFPARQVQNRGERPQYYAKETHPAIITEDVFAAAQELIQKRQGYFQPQPQEYAFRKAIICEKCKRPYRRKMVRGVPYWVCPTHENDKDQCQTTQIPEEEIEEAFLRLYYKLKHYGTPILKEMLSNLREVRDHRMLWSMDIIELNKKIADLTSQNQVLADFNHRGLIDPDIFISQTNALTEQLRAAKREKTQLLDKEEDQTIRHTTELLETLEHEPEFLDSFDGELFGELVERIIVEDNTRLRFQMRNGLELTEQIERTVR